MDEALTYLGGNCAVALKAAAGPVRHLVRMGGIGHVLSSLDGAAQRAVAGVVAVTAAIVLTACAVGGHASVTPEQSKLQSSAKHLGNYPDLSGASVVTVVVGSKALVLLDGDPIADRVLLSQIDRATSRRSDALEFDPIVWGLLHYVGRDRLQHHDELGAGHILLHRCDLHRDERPRPGAVDSRIHPARHRGEWNHQYCPVDTLGGSGID